MQLVPMLLLLKALSTCASKECIVVEVVAAAFLLRIYARHMTARTLLVIAKWSQSAQSVMHTAAFAL